MKNATDNTLDVWENLIIRATKNFKTKSDEDIRRYRRIWRMRCFLPNDYNCDHNIVYSMGKILEKRKSGNKNVWVKVIEALDPDQEWKNGFKEDTPYWHKVMFILASEIRLTGVSEWDGFKRPAKFRKK